MTDPPDTDYVRECIDLEVAVDPDDVIKLADEVDRLREDNEKLKTAVNQLGHEVSDGYNKIDRYRQALEKIETTINLGPELLALKRTKKIARAALAGEEKEGGPWQG